MWLVSVPLKFTAACHTGPNKGVMILTTLKITSQSSVLAHATGGAPNRRLRKLKDGCMAHGILDIVS